MSVGRTAGLSSVARRGSILGGALELLSSKQILLFFGEILGPTKPFRRSVMLGGSIPAECYFWGSSFLRSGLQILQSDVNCLGLTAIKLLL